MLVLGDPVGQLRVWLDPAADFTGRLELHQPPGTPTPWPAGLVAWLHLYVPGGTFDAVWPATIAGPVMSWDVPAAQVAVVPLNAWAELWLDYPDSPAFPWLRGPVGAGCGDSGFGHTVAVPSAGPDAIAVPVPGPPGPPGPGGGGGVVQAVTAHALSGHRLVTTTDSGLVEYADATNPAHQNRPVWITTGAWLAGVTATLTTAGLVTEPSWSWTPGLPILLGTNGFPVQTLPAGARFLRRVALPTHPDTIDFGPNQPVALT
ncbi:LtfC-like domain-containing protein [Nocardia cyriacigeorgica]|uniref:LtfC-like domain-containing protein n=1 Tax=Nocardia cyriacigeorgica TaxID=135487 RepID=UPI0018952851|nr:hypothetical protein [Nocardia cyriacigeorgica]MBF6416983.1 hypothetical protein [Nocardia cyriacigeorgica]